MEKYLYTIVTDNEDFAGEFNAKKGNFLEMLGECYNKIHLRDPKTESVVIRLKRKNNQDGG